MIMFIFERKTEVSNKGAYPLLIEEWREKILKRLSATEFQLSNMANFIAAFDRGRTSLFNELISNDWRVICPVLTIKKLGRSIFQQPDETNVCIAEEILQDYFDLSPDIWIERKFRKFSDVAFRGKPTDFFFLGGVEETFHAAFAQLPNHGLIISADLYAKSGAEYDSEETEYQSLLWRLKLAVLSEFPQETIEVLRERIQNAKAFRALRK